MRAGVSVEPFPVTDSSNELMCPETDSARSVPLLPVQTSGEHDHAWRLTVDGSYCCDLCPAVWTFESRPWIERAGC